MIVITSLVIVVLVVGSFLADCIPEVKNVIQCGANAFLEWILGGNGLSLVWNVKCALIENTDAFCNIGMTFATILGAAVTFFYSVQDNKKEGISHRTIISYSAGSFGISVLFLLTLLLVPISYISMAVGAYWTAFMSIFWGYVVDVTIIGLILLATSFQFSVHVLGNIEIRQFRAMDSMWEIYKKNDKRKMIDAETNYFYAWTYVPHHMEELMKSEELLSDKLVLVRRLLRVPFMEKEVLLLKEFPFFDPKRKCLELQAGNLEKNPRDRIYEYYYSNLLAVFNQIKKQEPDVRDKIYLVLYEFIDEMTCVYNKYARMCCRRRNKYKENYLMTLCGIMNAAMFSGIQEENQFCEYILYKMSERDEEKCIELNDVFTKLLGLNIIYSNAVSKLRGDQKQADDLQGKNVDKGNETYRYNTNHLNIDLDNSFYEEFWNVWMQYTTLTPNSRNNYLVDAIESKNKYMEILYKQKEKQYEDTLDSTDE